jgi:hypothetical protein
VSALIRLLEPFPRPAHRPMLASYPATYRDRNGEVRTTIRNDGQTLSMEVRGVDFRGTDFDMLEPSGGDTAAIEAYLLDHQSQHPTAIENEKTIAVAY